MDRPKTENVCLPKKACVCSLNSSMEKEANTKSVTNIVKQSYRKVISLSSAIATHRFMKCKPASNSNTNTNSNKKTNKNREFIVDSGDRFNFFSWGGLTAVIGRLEIVHMKKTVEINDYINSIDTENKVVDVYKGKTNVADVTGYALGVRLERRVDFILFFHKDCDPFQNCSIIDDDNGDNTNQSSSQFQQPQQTYSPHQETDYQLTPPPQPQCGQPQEFQLLQNEPYWQNQFGYLNSDMDSQIQFQESDDDDIGYNNINIDLDIGDNIDTYFINGNNINTYSENDGVDIAAESENDNNIDNYVDNVNGQQTDIEGISDNLSSVQDGLIPFGGLTELNEESSGPELW